MADNTENNEQLYKRVARLVDDWAELHIGETFDLDTVCRQLDIVSREGRRNVSKKLSYDVKQGKFEKNSKSYRYIDSTLTLLNWNEVEKSENLKLAWPFGVEDESTFGFEESVLIPEKGVIVLAGVTNTGKSTFCRNFLWCNMDHYHCTYFSSETSAEDFADYASRMDWREPMNGNGPKFNLVYRTRDWKDVIQPDDINIIDWLNIGDNFYQIGQVIEGIKEKLNKGIVLIAIQKDPQKEYGLGGMFSEHLASLYLSIDFSRLTVKKAKKWHNINPNGTMWGFDIVNSGTHFHRIHEVKKCPRCFGTGRSRGSECEDCKGRGFADV